MAMDYGTSESLEAAGRIAILRMGNIQDGEVSLTDLKYLDNVEPELLLAVGDLLYNRTNSLDQVGKVGLFRGHSQPTSFASYLVRMRAGSDTVPTFLTYCLNTEAVLGIARGSAFIAIGQCNLNPTRYGEIAIAAPPRDEQQAIATFLDCETAKIDALIAEQERLIALLKETRQAVISHAVTKGLNPDSPTRDSGVSSFGRIPTHWRVVTIKWFAKLQRGHDLTDAERQEGPYPVVTSGGVTGSHSQFMARGPGVVTGRYGSTGRLFYVEEDYWPHNTALYVVDFHGNHRRFVYFSLQTVDFAAHSAKAAVPGVDRNDIHVLPVVVPPLDEQVAISEFLDRKSAGFDALIAEAQHAVRLLEERRAALISAAVTGQIDVRPESMRSAA